MNRFCAECNTTTPQRTQLGSEQVWFLCTRCYSLTARDEPPDWKAAAEKAEAELAARKQKRDDDLKRMHCIHCDIVSDPYMAHDELWRRMGLDKRQCVCLTCLRHLVARHFGRELRIDDAQEEPTK